MLITEENHLKGFVKIYQSFLDAIKGYEDSVEFAEKIARWDAKKMLKSFTVVAEPMRSGFLVLNHGDMWLNNMMFKNDSEGNAVDVSLIDFQGSFWGGPSGDLHYFLVSSVADDIKIEYYDEFVAFYHQNLVESLKKLKYAQPIPTLDEIHNDLIDKGIFREFNFFLSFLSFCLKYQSEITTFNKFTNKHSIRSTTRSLDSSLIISFQLVAT